MDSPKERIKAWREALGLTRTEVARSIGAESSYYGIELHEDEVFATPLEQIKRLYQVLKRSLWDLFDLSCDFCSHATDFNSEYSLPRSELIRACRLAKGWSPSELGDLIGFCARAVEEMETDPDFLDSWSFDLVKELAVIIGVPLELLLGIKCPQCGR